MTAVAGAHHALPPPTPAAVRDAAVAQHKSNGERSALVLVPTSSDAGVDDGGCSARRATAVCLHVAADQAAGNHIDDSHNRGKGRARRRQSAGGTQMSAIGVVPFGSAPGLPLRVRAITASANPAATPGS